MDRFLFHSNSLHDQQQQQPPPLDKILSLPIILTDRILTAVTDSKSFKLECTEIGKHVNRISDMLRSVVRLSDSTPSFYDRPVRRIFTDVAGNLNRTLSLVRKCRIRSFFRRFVSIVTVSDFRKVFNLLNASIGDLKWLLDVFSGAGESDGTGGIFLTLPPIANNDPILAWIWSYIASLYICSLNVKIEVANELSVLARDSDRNKMVIIEEGGISPLLKLLKEDASADAQIASAVALFSLVNDQFRASCIFNEHGVPIIVNVFRNSSVFVQIEVAKLIARMAEYDSASQEGFARENLVGVLVTLLSFDIDDDDSGKGSKFWRRSIGSADEIKKGMMDKSYGKKRAFSSSIWPRNRKEMPHVILVLKTNCSGALWMLAKGNVANCRKITETKGLLCLAKLIESEKEELQYNCLMTVLEITAVAEQKSEFRRAAFKTSSPAAKAVSDQILRLVNQSDNPAFKIPAIRAIGHLARIFPARQTQVICPLVKQLSQRNADVAIEAVITLGKFTCPDNFLCAEHSKTICEFEGVQHLLRLLRGNDKTQYHALALLCYLSMHVESNEPSQQVRLLTALEGADKSVACQHTELRELVAQAVYHLKVSGAGLIRSQSLSYSR
ncbi:uncharacterized protein [Rutidosis leptorrhynchoides]|uniref:uncharacterized protein n=1 Tax=Rutidosis leptorrhynchoides TaxID=125765 RepID=UPI003A99E993